MANRLFLFTNWITSDPRRVLMIVVAISLTLLLIAALMPAGSVFAGPAPGGSS